MMVMVGMVGGSDAANLIADQRPLRQANRPPSQPLPLTRPFTVICEPFQGHEASALKPKNEAGAAGKAGVVGKAVGHVFELLAS